MLSRTFKLQVINGGSGCVSLFFRTLLNFSTSAEKAQPQKGIVADYLLNSLGFSKEAAISTSNKVIPVKPIKKNPHLVVKYLENLGLNKSQIKNIVSASPSLLFYNADKTLVPKIKFLKDLGLHGSDLVKIIMYCQPILSRSLDCYLKPRIDYLRELFGTDDKVVKALKRYPLMLVRYNPDKVAKNVVLLKEIGISSEVVAKFILRKPRLIFAVKAEWFRDVMHRVESDLGIPRESDSFFKGVEALCSVSKSTIKKKLDTLRSFGWSDEDIRNGVRCDPTFLCRSEVKIRNCLSFLMVELGYTPQYIVSSLAFFSLSLEKRVKPRYEVLKILNAKKMNKKKAVFYSVVCLSEEKFVEDYLLPYKDKIPSVYGSYLKGVGSQQIVKL